MRILEGKDSKVTPKQSEDWFLWLISGLVAATLFLWFMGIF